MKANLVLLAPIACLVVGTSDRPAAAQAAPYQQPAASALPDPQPAPPGTVDWSRVGPETTLPRYDYPGPALRGGNGGG